MRQAYHAPPIYSRLCAVVTPSILWSERRRIVADCALGYHVLLCIRVGPIMAYASTTRHQALLKKSLKITTYFLLAIVAVSTLAYFAVSGYVNRQLTGIEHKSYDSCHKVWSARGIYDRHKQGGIQRNSIESVTKAFEMGGHGVEVDVYFDPEAGHFVVSHGNPLDKDDTPRLTLVQLFRATAVNGQGHFWLDYKNLRSLSDTQTEAAIARLLAITADEDLRQRVYIEGADPIKLPRYRRAGLNTLYDVHPPEDSWPVTTFVINIYKAAFYFGGHSAMTMAYGEVDAPIFGQDTRALLGDIPLFLYHVPNDDQLLRELVADDAVRVVLVGRDQSVGRFEINDCATGPAGATISE